MSEDREKSDKSEEKDYSTFPSNFGEKRFSTTRARALLRGQSTLLYNYNNNNNNNETTTTTNLSISRDVKPDPVPPPKEWKMRNPWRKKKRLSKRSRRRRRKEEVEEGG